MMHGLQSAIEETATILGINKPRESASEEELRIWIEWWRPSVEAAREMCSEDMAYLRAGGWWPPVTAAQISAVPPVIVRQTTRPSLYAAIARTKLRRL